MPQGLVIIDENRCKGCALCVNVCPAHNLRLAEGRFNDKGLTPVEIIDPQACTGCAVCTIVCPDAVFTVYRRKPALSTVPACPA